MIRVLIAALILTGPAFAADLPNPDLTPGAIRDGITAADLCPVAHTAKVRNVPEALKRQVYKRYGLKGNHTGYCKGKAGCEIDHACSLENGGSNDITNLWPEPFSGTVWNAHVKDRLENEVHRRMCAGELTPQQACAALATDWIGTYRKYLGDP
jgi:hypothetical protein